MFLTISGCSKTSGRCPSGAPSPGSPAWSPRRPSTFSAATPIPSSRSRSTTAIPRRSRISSYAATPAARSCSTRRVRGSVCVEPFGNGGAVTGTLLALSKKGTAFSLQLHPHDVHTFTYAADGEALLVIHRTDEPWVEGPISLEEIAGEPPLLERGAEPRDLGGERPGHRRASHRLPPHRRMAGRRAPLLHQHPSDVPVLRILRLRTHGRKVDRRARRSSVNRTISPNGAS